MFNVMRIGVVGVGLALLAGCGSGSSPSATKTKSFDEALGLDQASMQAREAKVQEFVRTCMKQQGFDYIPVDSSASNMKFAVGGISGGFSDDPKTLRTKGYGITELPPSGATPHGQDDDPNKKIRDALSETDQQAYDRALYGDSATVEHGPGGQGVHIQVRSSGGNGEGPSTTADNGCFGTAQQQVPGGPKKLGSTLEDLDKRISNDPRLVNANRAWASCMAKAGYADWEKPDDIPHYLMDKLAKATGSTEGNISIDATKDQVALSALHDEEMAIARADADCTEKTKRNVIAKTVREEAQAKFLDEHPDLTVK